MSKLNNNKSKNLKFSKDNNSEIDEKNQNLLSGRESNIDPNVVLEEEPLESKIYRENYKLQEEIIFYEFLNFLEIYINSIIYIANVYPVESFVDFKVYNLNFLKFNINDMVTKYISDFLANIESFIFSRILNKIYILIVDADSNTILEIFNLDLNIPCKFYYELNYDELCLNFKSLLYKLYLSSQGRKKMTNLEKMKYNQENNNEINKTFLLCVETKEDKIITNLKLYENIFSTIEEKFIKSLFEKDLMNIFENREILSICDDYNISISISRNYLN